MNIPDYMPILSAGGHESPADGACIMELASFLAGEEWTDQPECVSPVLAVVARHVNDDLDDTERMRLLPLLPRLMGTTKPKPGADAIRVAAAKFVEHLAGHENRSVSLSAEFVNDPHNSPLSVAWEGQIAVSLAGMDQIEYLSALIDAYDAATGRTAPATVTEDDLRRCAELTGATR